jgi:hypothetical protein
VLKENINIMENQKCKCSQETLLIKFEADFGADPIWCSVCGSNLAIIDFGLREDFIEEIYQWLSKYIEWIDLETDSLVEGAQEMQRAFNEQGFILCEKFKQIIGGKYTVEYRPADSVSWYQNK